MLKYRAKGFTQKETAEALATSRSNVSMIESRARMKLRHARATVRTYQSLLSAKSIIIERGTRLQELPFRILDEGDRQSVHLKSNISEIIKLVKMFEPKSVHDGKTTRDLRFVFNARGRLSLLGISRRKARTPRSTSSRHENTRRNVLTHKM